MKHNQIIGPGKNNYGRGWGYKGANKCPQCNKPTHPNEIKICDGVCHVCSVVNRIKKRKNKDD